MMLCLKHSCLFGPLFGLLLLVDSANASSLPDFTDLVKQETPAVVNISTTQKVHQAHSRFPHGIPNLPGNPPFDDFFRRFFDDDKEGDGEDYETESLGSGFIISDDGYILTNYHVVNEANEIIVRLNDHSEVDAEIVGSDKRSDIALLKVDKKNLPFVRIGNPKDLEVGEWVLAIGSPFGFDHSVTAGIVSAKRRTLPNENYVPFIQTDVAINPGNSGGPLFNMKGEVVGVNSQIYSRTGGYMGLSFSVPIDMAMDVVRQLRENGKVTRGWLGVLIQSVTRDLAESFGMDRPIGALVAKVFPDSPSERAGIKTGDIIVEFNHHEVTSSSNLPPLVGITPVDEEVPVRIIRDGKSRMIKVRLGELPEEEELAQKESDSHQGRTRLLGLTVEELTSETRNAMDAPDLKGVVVKEVKSGPGKDAGIMPGDVIVRIGPDEVKDISSFRSLVKKLPSGKAVSLLVQRKSGPLFLALRVEND
ncbi:MAG: DegQ family serine endoprotease [Gammaproteobacteria bacterium]|nr:MAG: DegQ family serine endoprotease [Gammaproteobacteria bacterium]